MNCSSLTLNVPHIRCPVDRVLGSGQWLLKFGFWKFHCEYGNSDTIQRLWIAIGDDVEFTLRTTASASCIKPITVAAAAHLLAALLLAAAKTLGEYTKANEASTQLRRFVEGGLPNLRMFWRENIAEEHRSEDLSRRCGGEAWTGENRTTGGLIQMWQHLRNYWKY